MEKKSTAGGYRIGSGRPKGTGKFGEATQAIRVPISLLPQIQQFIQTNKTPVSTMPMAKHYSSDRSTSTVTVPWYSTKIAAGVPTLAEEHIATHLDLHQHLIKHPASTFLVTVEGDSMIDAGIYEGDILVVDRALPPTSGKIVIAVINNELTVKRLNIQKTEIRLLPENPKYAPIMITEESQFSILGVVIHAIHAL